ECQIEVPEFTHLSDAEQFLAKIAALVAHGELDIQTGLELSTLAKNWIDAQYETCHQTDQRRFHRARANHPHRRWITSVTGHEHHHADARRPRDQWERPRSCRAYRCCAGDRSCSQGPRP